jgi:hypothetical protein
MDSVSETRKEIILSDILSENEIEELNKLKISDQKELIKKKLNY